MALYDEAAEQPPYCDQCGTCHFGDCLEEWSEVIERVVDALDEAEGRTLTQIAEATGLRLSVVRIAMRELLADGDIQRDESDTGWMLT